MGRPSGHRARSGGGDSRQLPKADWTVWRIMLPAAVDRRIGTVWAGGLLGWRQPLRCLRRSGSRRPARAVVTAKRTARPNRPQAERGTAVAGKRAFQCAQACSIAAAASTAASTAA